MGSRAPPAVAGAAGQLSPQVPGGLGRTFELLGGAAITPGGRAEQTGLFAHTDAYLCLELTLPLPGNLGRSRQPGGASTPSWQWPRALGEGRSAESETQSGRALGRRGRPLSAGFRGGSEPGAPSPLCCLRSSLGCGLAERAASAFLTHLEDEERGVEQGRVAVVRAPGREGAGQGSPPSLPSLTVKAS